MSNNKTGDTKKFRSLAATLVLAFLLISLTILLISGGLEMYFSFQNQQQNIITQQHMIAQDAANTVKSFIQEKFSVMETAASLGSLQSAQQKDQKLLLDKLLGREPSFRQLVIIDRQNHNLAEASRLSQTASERLYNRLNSDISLGTGERYVSEIYIDKTTSEPMIVMAVPIKDTFGDFHGTIAAEVNLKFMWDLVNDIKVGNGGTAYVVNKQGNLIAFGDISRVLKGENVAQLDEVSKFVKGDVLVHEDNANMSKGIRGNTVVANHAHLGTPDWAVVVEMPAGEAYAPTISSAEVTILIVAANIMLVVLIGVYISRKITKPIISLRDAAKKIGMGSLNIKIKTATKNEIGELATSFNEMQRQLRISREELGKYTKNLEKMVKDRTSDLNSKVNELERFQKVSIERELRMIELKKRIKELEEGRK